MPWTDEGMLPWTNVNGFRIPALYTHDVYPSQSEYQLGRGCRFAGGVSAAQQFARESGNTSSRREREVDVVVRHRNWTRENISRTVEVQATFTSPSLRRNSLLVHEATYHIVSIGVLPYPLKAVKHRCKEASIIQRCCDAQLFWSMAVRELMS